MCDVQKPRNEPVSGFRVASLRATFDTIKGRRVGGRNSRREDEDLDYLESSGFREATVRARNEKKNRIVLGFVVGQRQG